MSCPCNSKIFSNHSTKSSCHRFSYKLPFQFPFQKIPSMCFVVVAVVWYFPCFDALFIFSQVNVVSDALLVLFILCKSLVDLILFSSIQIRYIVLFLSYCFCIQTLLFLTFISINQLILQRHGATVVCVTKKTNRD